MKNLMFLTLTAFAIDANAAAAAGTLPEPSNLALLAIGGVAFVAANWRNRRK